MDKACWFVSHNTSAVARLCTRAGILLRSGQPGMPGERGRRDGHLSSGQLGFFTCPGERFWDSGDAPGDGIARLLRVRVCDELGKTRSSVDAGDFFDVEMEFEVLAEDVTLFPSVTINNEWGTAVLWSTDSGTPDHGRPRQAGFYRASVRVPGDLLAEGTMTVTAAMTSLAPRQEHFCANDAVRFLVTDRVDGSSARGVYTDYINAVVRPRLEWSIQFDPATPVSTRAS